MRIDIKLCCLPALAFLALAAQTTKPQEVPDKRPQDRAQEPAKPVMDAGPMFAHVEVGPKAAINDDKGQPLGVLKDQVINRRSGEALFFVVEVQGDAGAKTVLVPLDRFTWNKEKHDWVLRATKTDLATMQVFDPAKLQSLHGARTRVEPAGGARDAGAPKEANEPPERAGDPTGAGAKPEADAAAKAKMEEVRNLLASELTRASVAGSNGPFGTISNLLIEPRTGEIAFVLVRGGAEAGKEGGYHAVPWRALSWMSDGKFVIPMTVAELSSSPQIQPAEIKALSKEDTLNDIYEFYHVPPPAPANTPPKG